MYAQSQLTDKENLSFSVFNLLKPSSIFTIPAVLTFKNSTWFSNCYCSVWTLTLQKLTDWSRVAEVEGAYRAVCIESFY